jgi:hypothetical protein
MSVARADGSPRHPFFRYFNWVPQLRGRRESCICIKSNRFGNTWQRQQNSGKEWAVDRT